MSLMMVLVLALVLALVLVLVLVKVEEAMGAVMMAVDHKEFGELVVHHLKMY